MNKPKSFIKATDAPTRTTSRYPAPYDEPCKARTKYLLGDAFGLSQFGVNLVTLEPGAWSSQRHWHEKEDELIYVISGEITMVDDAGEHKLEVGSCAGYKGGNSNGHHLKNLSREPAQYLEIGTRLANDKAWYPDIDMKVEVKDWVGTYSRKDGSPFK